MPIVSPFIGLKLTIGERISRRLCLYYQLLLFKMEGESIEINW